jgi:hypothetical protein
MPVERVSSQASLMDVLDRVLDKGVVIDAWVRLSLVGIDLITLEARVVVASIETYLHHSAALADARTAARPGTDAQRRSTSLTEVLGGPRPVPSTPPIVAPLGPAVPLVSPLSPPKRR